MIHWTCDRCDSVVEGEPMTLLVNATLTQERPIVVHLCADCKETFGAWLGAARPVEAAPEATPEARPDGRG